MLDDPLLIVKMRFPTSPVTLSLLRILIAFSIALSMNIFAGRESMTGYIILTSCRVAELDGRGRKQGAKQHEG